MSIAITGASGQLGRLVVESLLDRGVTPSDIVAIVRTPAKIDDLAARGVVVRTASYDDRAALTEALAGVDRVLLVSGNEMGKRVAQHGNVIAAAKDAGVGHIAYTSIPDATTTPLLLAGEHKATEQLLAESGLPTTLLRNGWYWENYTGDLAGTVERGVLAGSARDGRVAAAARRDYADAAATVLTTDGHEGKTYELGGDQRLTYTELAEQLSAVAGKTVEYRDLPKDAYANVLQEAGLPADYAAVLADSDAGIAVGALDVTSGDLQRLIGRPSTPVADVFRAAL
ncbi:SDR family oxidoreductase [Antrihabitans cavernicola]|uniref:SDR family oxidoreductase n=1 Tax=Antrihabitans cavernicola TaxID=2495913 RepID=A0A5A7S7W9_9NOCA|nr:SDR family oxidoreductase [Spelaeibacter cavernicola]KAA0022240.1 SDR family oxidoreductase [Spelaeibacter cavernicola]